MSYEECGDSCPLVYKFQQLEKDHQRIIEDVKALKRDSKNNEHGLTKLSETLTIHMLKSEERDNATFEAVKRMSETLSHHMKEEEETVSKVVTTVNDFRKAMIGENGDGSGALDKINQRLTEGEKKQISIKEKQVIIWSVLTAMGSGVLGLAFWLIKGQIGG